MNWNFYKGVLQKAMRSKTYQGQKYLIRSGEDNREITPDLPRSQE